METCQQLEKPTKGSKGKKAFFCSFADGGYPVITSPGVLVRVPEHSGATEKLQKNKLYIR